LDAGNKGRIEFRVEEFRRTFGRRAKATNSPVTLPDILEYLFVSVDIMVKCSSSELRESLKVFVMSRQCHQVSMMRRREVPILNSD
jgi:hypothetical protein